MSDRYTLYGAELSLYSGKARSYLRKKGLAFDEVAASIKVYRQIIVPNTGVQFIPVVKTPAGEYLQDTSIIIENLESANPQHPVVPQTPKQRFVAELLELYADEWLLVPAMHYRWNFPGHNQPFIFQEFGRFLAPWAPAFVRGLLGKKAAKPMQAAVKRLGIDDTTIPVVEASYLGLLDDLEAHFEEHLFLFGSTPCIADFGFIGPLYAHLYRDPAPGALMRKRNPGVAAWVERMISEEASLQSGELLSNDEIPATLEPIVQRMAAEQYPVLLDTNKRLSEWRSSNPEATQAGASIPRSIGQHDFVIEGVSGKRMVLPYSLWMLQRLLERNDLVSLESDAAFSAWLAKIGLGGILNQSIAEPMDRINNKLSFRHALS